MLPEEQTNNFPIHSCESCECDASSFLKPCAGIISGCCNERYCGWSLISAEASFDCWLNKEGQQRSHHLQWCGLGWKPAVLNGLTSLSKIIMISTLRKCLDWRSIFKKCIVLLCSQRTCL